MNTTLPKHQWEHLQELLDRRLDPFEDPQLQAHLFEHPEHAQALLDLLEQLRSMPSGELQAQHSKRVGVLAYALLLSAACLAIFVRPPAPESSPAQLSNPRIASAPGVSGLGSSALLELEFSHSVQRSGARLRRDFLWRDGTLVQVASHLEAQPTPKGDGQSLGTSQVHDFQVPQSGSSLISFSLTHSSVPFGR